MRNPFADAKTAPDDERDAALVARAVAGSNAALNELLHRHQGYVYNVAVRMTLSPADAADLTQEVLLKIATRLAQFRGEAAFRTWAYRIAVNHFLSARKHALEEAIVGFDEYDRELAAIPDEEPDQLDRMVRDELIAEARVGCLLGMLLCLSREQRVTYIVGELFGADHRTAAAVLALTPAAFRKRLERARRDLRTFMQRRCGLLDPANPCRCSRKTAGFIRAGWVDPEAKRFRASRLASLGEAIEARADRLDELVDERVAEIHRETPWMGDAYAAESLQNALADQCVRDLFDLD